MTNSNTYDVIVLGVGGMGASACMHLAARGKRVLGLEQFSLAHDRGSSHGGSRIIRDCYFEHPNYVPLLLRCNELWRELEQRTGQSFVHRVGVLYMAHAKGIAVDRSYSSGQAHGVQCTRMSPADVRKLFPQFEVPADWQALLEPDAGFVRPERAVQAHALVARQLGADIHERETVMEWTDESVTTERGTYQAETLIVCAGAWTPALAKAFGCVLQPLRVPIAWLAPVDRAACTAPRMPVWYVEPDDAAPVYGVPLAPGQGQADGVKVAQHGGVTAHACDPRTVDRVCSAAEREHLRQATARFVPCAAGQAVDGAVCLYTMTPDQHFIIDRLPGHPSVFVACGFSGHGFKFTPVVGEILAELACDGRTRHAIEFLRAGRFAAG